MKLLNHSFLVRALSGAAFVVIMLGATLLSQWSFVALLAVIFCGCLWEFRRMALKMGAQPLFWFPAIAGLGILGLNFWFAPDTFPAIGVPMAAMLTALPIMLSIPIIELYRKKENPLANIGASFISFIYILFPLCLLHNMAFMNQYYDGWRVVWLLLIIWSNDVGAYIFGALFGKHKLFERISPKKTWEGFCGGIIVAAAVALAASQHRNEEWFVWLIVGVVAAVSGVFGDLVESMFKRSAGVKDSGSMMPGHGGFLDRFDAMLYAAPFAYMVFLLLNI